MTRIALLSSEPIRPRMAGIGIRYAELARRLAALGFRIRLVSPASAGEMRAVVDGVDAQTFERGRLAELLRDCDAAVAQGHLANDLVTELPELPTAIDLYDPWLVENLSYAKTLGLGPYRNDHATWILQMSRGDFFLCSSSEQRNFYLGFLLALGRVNPERIAQDPDLSTLIAPVPFGVPAELPIHRPVLPPREPGEKRILFGGLYDWYDPFTLLEAVEELARSTWTVLFIRNPNPETTPQGLLAKVEAHCRKRGSWGSNVKLLDWVPTERRYDLLRDVDVMAAPHQPSLESAISLRTRFLDALAAGCPLIASEGGTMSRLLREHRAGWVVPPGDAKRLGACLVEALESPMPRERIAGAGTLLEDYRWERALEPLVRFLRNPVRDMTKERFVSAIPTKTPEESLRTRAGRWVLSRAGFGRLFS